MKKKEAVRIYTVETTSNQVFDKEVTDHLGSGWYLYGDPKVFSMSNYVIYIQMLII